MRWNGSGAAVCGSLAMIRWRVRWHIQPGWMCICLCGCVVDHVLMRSMIYSSSPPPPTKPTLILTLELTVTPRLPPNPPTPPPKIDTCWARAQHLSEKESACLGNSPQETPKKFALPKPVIDSVTLTHVGRFFLRGQHSASCCLYRPLKETMKPFLIFFNNVRYLVENKNYHLLSYFWLKLLFWTISYVSLKIVTVTHRCPSPYCRPCWFHVY